MIFKIGPSKVHGNGVIAVRDIAKGETIGTAIIYKAFRPEVTDMGKYVNHSYQPNSRLQFVAGRYDLVATEYIKADEEIIADYNDTPRFLEKPKPDFC